MTEWGYAHKTVNHGQGEYARDEDGDGFHEVHVNTIENSEMAHILFNIIYIIRSVRR